MDKNIEAFKKMDSNEAIELLFKDNCHLTQRIDKAVEYIELKRGKNKSSYDTILLNILKGGSDDKV